MVPWVLILAALVGLILGSFINTVADRLPQGRSLVRPRSCCPGCGRGLTWWELIPVFGYFLVKGRCRTCGRAIGWRTPAVEGLTAGVAVAISVRVGFGPEGGLALVAAGTLIALSVIDLETGFLPDRLTLPLAAGGLAWSWAVGPGLKVSLLGLVICGGLLWAVGLGYLRLTGREGLGGGDPKLAAGLGAWLGPEVGLWAVVWGAGLGSILGLSLVARGKAGFKTALPFGPFLALSGLAWLLIRPPFGR
ncbi:MAG: prepilin peptidase [Deltaproteobacteria bacterium]|nr:prepilin peptidase [Deltaproteobacteria bacterium]